MAIEIRVDTGELEQWIAHLKDAPIQLVRIATESMQATIKLAEKFAVENVSNQILRRRSGNLAGSIGSRVVVGTEVQGGGGGISGQLGFFTPKMPSVLVYGPAQEFGAEAKPVNAQVMTIPLAAALFDTGVPRFTALGAKEFYDRTFWYKDILYGVLVGQGKGRRKQTRRFGQRGDRQDKLVPLFWGARYVKIGGGPGRGRRFLRSAAEKAVPILRKTMETSIVKMLAARGQPKP